MNKNTPIFIVALAAVTALWLGAATQARGEIYATKLDGLCEEDGTGVYDAVFKELGQTYKVLPATRAEKIMKEEKACLFPLDKRFLTSELPLIQSEPIQVVKIIIFAKDKVYTSLAELQGKTVGLRLGLNYGANVEKGAASFKVDKVNNLDLSIKKLMGGRVDAIVEFEPDVLDYLKKNKVTLAYDANSPVDRHSDAVTCVQTPDNEKLISSFNEKLQSKANQVQKILNQ